MTKPITKINQLKADKANANKGTARGGAMINKSLVDNGFGRPILLDKNGNIIGGNKTIENARKAGLTEVIVVQSTGTEVIAHQRMDIDIDTPEGRRLAIADNQTANVNLDWDSDVLRGIEADGVDLTEFFNDGELIGLALREPPIELPEEFKDVDETLPTEHCCPSCGFKWSGKSA